MGNKASIARFLNNALLPKKKKKKKTSSFRHRTKWKLFIPSFIQMNLHIQRNLPRSGGRCTTWTNPETNPEANNSHVTRAQFISVNKLMLPISDGPGGKKKHVDYKVTVIFLGKRERWFLRKYFWSSPSVGSQHTAPTNWLHCNSAIKQQQNHHTPQLYSLKSLGMGKAQGGTKN